MIATIGKYQIEQEIGRGGFGRVYRAFDPTVGRPVAIKTLETEPDEYVMARFRNEALAIGKLVHRNIVTVYEFGEYERLPYIVMEYLEGESLRQAISKTAPLRLVDKIRIMSEIADGLRYAHENGVIHRDVKPDNVMLLPNGGVKIMDFGLARVTHSPTRATQRGLFIGTVRYLAPEQFQGDPADALSDIWSYGVTCYELLTGADPFGGGDLPAVMYRITMTDAPVPSSVSAGVPPELDAIVSRCLSRDRGLRYQCMVDVQFDLQPLLIEARHREAVRILEEARSSIQRADLEKAGAIVRDALALEPNNQEARQLRARLAEALSSTPVVPQAASEQQGGVASHTKSLSEGARRAHGEPSGGVTAPTAPARSIGQARPGQQQVPLSTPQQVRAPTVEPQPPRPSLFRRFTSLFSRDEMLSLSLDRNSKGVADDSSPSSSPKSGGATETFTPIKSSGDGKPPGPSVSPGEFTRMFPPAAPAGEQTRMLRLPLERRFGADEVAKRQAKELIELAERQAFQRVVTLEGEWLPGVEGAAAPLLSFREAARYLIAANAASGAHNALEHLKRAESALVAAANQVLQDRSALAVHLPPALEVWKQLTRTRIRVAEELLAQELPNPFRAGQPLRPDQGRSVFRGREHIVRQIETILADARQSGSMALIGPRRCGKTSVLQMLPSLLPDCICVFFDLQDNAVDSPQAFFTALERQAREQARRDRRVVLPALGDGGTFASAAEWLQALDRIEGEFRILICIDEFERLEDLFPGDPQDLLRLMGLLRATIQHRQKVRLLVSGVAPFEELGQIWNDHFINVREIRVGHLDRTAALDLLMRPLPDFPAHAISEEVAGYVYERTGGQPYLLQLYGFLLIEQLNSERRQAANREDVERVEEQAMEQGTFYFRNAYEGAPVDAQAALNELAAGGKPEMPLRARRWLLRRGLIEGDGGLAIPVLGRFISEEMV